MSIKVEFDGANIGAVRKWPSEAQIPTLLNGAGDAYESAPQRPFFIPSDDQNGFLRSLPLFGLLAGFIDGFTNNPVRDIAALTQRQSGVKDDPFMTAYFNARIAIEKIALARDVSADGMSREECFVLLEEAYTLVNDVAKAAKHKFEKLYIESIGIRAQLVFLFYNITGFSSYHLEALFELKDYIDALKESSDPADKAIANRLLRQYVTSEYRYDAVDRSVDLMPRPAGPKYDGMLTLQPIDTKTPLRPFFGNQMDFQSLRFAKSGVMQSQFVELSRGLAVARSRLIQRCEKK